MTSIITTTILHKVDTFTTPDLSVAKWYAIFNQNEEDVPFLTSYDRERIAELLSREFGAPPPAIATQDKPDLYFGKKEEIEEIEEKGDKDNEPTGTF